MHGIKSNKHLMTIKRSANVSNSHQASEPKPEHDGHGSLEKKSKHVYGHTMADIEQQISDWLVDTSNIKNDTNNISKE